MLSENEIVTKVLNVCFKLHSLYGPGLFESVYEELLCYELGKLGMLYKRQQGIPLLHETIKLKIGFRADLIVEQKVIFELKSIEALADVHYRQLLTYLKLTQLKLGVLINFNVPHLKDGIHRIANKL